MYINKKKSNRYYTLKTIPCNNAETDELTSPFGAEREGVSYHQRSLAGGGDEVTSPSGTREKAVSDFIQIDPLCAIIIADYIRRTLDL